MVAQDLQSSSYEASPSSVALTRLALTIRSARFLRGEKQMDGHVHTDA